MGFSNANGAQLTIEIKVRNSLCIVGAVAFVVVSVQF